MLHLDTQKKTRTSKSAGVKTITNKKCYDII